MIEGELCDKRCANGGARHFGIEVEDRAELGEVDDRLKRAVVIGRDELPRGWLQVT